MNAENYVKAFQGVMGVYGLQFLLVPKKIVRFFVAFLSLSCVIVESVFLQLFHFFVENPVDRIEERNIAPARARARKLKTHDSCLANFLSLFLSLSLQ